VCCCYNAIDGASSCCLVASTTAHSLLQSAQHSVNLYIDILFTCFTMLCMHCATSQTAPLPYCSTVFSSTINAMPAPMRSVSRSSSNSTTVATNTHSNSSSSARSPPLQHEAVTVALQAIAVARGGVTATAKLSNY
jgi:hypothetical protein